MVRSLILLGWICRWAVDGAGGEGDGAMGRRVTAGVIDILQRGMPSFTPFVGVGNGLPCV